VKRRSVFALSGVATGLALLVGVAGMVAASTAAPVDRPADPYFASTTTPDAAIASVKAMAAIPQTALAVTGLPAKAARTADLAATGPFDGDLFSYYKVTGHDVYATVDVHDNHVATLVLANQTPTTKSASVISPDRALSMASSYLSDHGIGTAGLTPVVEKTDRGEVTTYRVTWQRTVNGALVPDSRFVELDASSGAVFAVYNVSRPYSTPPTAVVSSDAAAASAEAAVTRSLGATGSDKPTLSVEEARLQVSFDSTGTQGLIWVITVAQHDLGQYSIACVITVDAMTGAATLVR
jgi:hypothetical protein